MAAGITQLTDQTFDEEIRSSDSPVLVDFSRNSPSASWTLRPVHSVSLAVVISV